MKTLVTFPLLIVFLGLPSFALSKKDVQKEIRERRTEIHTCYSRRLKKKPRLEGKTILEWDINDQGKVENIRIVEKTDRRMDRCIAKIISEIEFPKLQEGQVAKYRYPFEFNAAPIDKDSVRPETVKEEESTTN